MSSVTERVRAHLVSEESDLLAGIVDCADAVAAGWPERTTTDRSNVVPPFETVLARAGITDQLPSLLARCVDAAGYDLAAPPVAAPPYVVVTATGPMLRATLEPGRLVVSLRVFEVERGEDAGCDGFGDGNGDDASEGDLRYRRRGETPAEIVSVELR
ncbi:hypothetical protein [Haloprofundus halophilus]|uniref:hypothetical protein n=1 Tax=Haloprofundus halophilus TaxID=2283527 RepID=UPI000E448C87|nr:hypothetical protein [Haloprofundus halophilus]